MRLVRPPGGVHEQFLSLPYFQLLQSTIGYLSNSWASGLLVVIYDERGGCFVKFIHAVIYHNGM